MIVKTIDGSNPVSIVTEDLPGESSCEAEGHPSECAPTFDGEIQYDGTHSVSVNDSNGDVRRVSTKDSATMHFDSHGHGTDSDDNCDDYQTHDLDPDNSELIQTLHIVTPDENSLFYKVGDGVTTDPGSDGDVNITSGT